MTTNPEIRAIFERLSTFDPHKADALEIEAALRDIATVDRWLAGIRAQLHAALAREDRRHPRPLAATVRRGPAR